MKSITREQAKHYGKYAATLVAGAGVGLTGYAVNDTPTQQTDTYQNLQDKLTNAQDDNSELQDKISDLNTTVTDKKDRISNLNSQVAQFEETVQELKDENADLEDKVAQGEERVGLVDYFPVFTENTDVEYDSFNGLAVDQDYEDGEGDYTRVNVETVDPVENHEYDVTVTQFEAEEDAEDYADDERDYQDEVSFSADGDQHTVGITAKEGSSGEFNGIHINYEDDDVLDDVNDEDDIESVVVDGEDITDDVESISIVDGTELQVSLTDDKNYVNEGDEVSVTFSQATGDDAPDYVEVNGVDYDYEQDVDEFVFRDGNTVVTGTGDEDVEDGDEDDYDAQYEEFVSQYE